MNKVYPYEGILKKWLRKSRSPIPSFYGIRMTPEIIYQEMMQSGKPVAWYEMLIFSVISGVVLTLGLLSMAGVKWDAWVGIAGSIVTISFLILETILYRVWSFSRGVQQARLVIIFYTIPTFIYFMYLR